MAHARRHQSAWCPATGRDEPDYPSFFLDLRDELVALGVSDLLEKSEVHAVDVDAK